MTLVVIPDEYKQQFSESKAEAEKRAREEAEKRVREEAEKRVKDEATKREEEILRLIEGPGKK